MKLSNRTTWKENCFACAYFKYAGELAKGKCGLDNHNLELSEDYICSLFLSDFDGHKIIEVIK